MDQAELRRKIIAISTDASLSEAEKAQKRQELLSGKWHKPVETSANDAKDDKATSGAEPESMKTMFDESLQCSMCMELCNRPVSAPCQHNFCLSCFNRWVNQGKKTCPTCRHAIPAKFAANPRINTALACAIRMAKQGNDKPKGDKVFERINDKDRPDEAFTTERAQRAGRANAASGRIMVTIPGDWFGPIPAEHDPRGQGILVGEFWKDRLDCRQWGAHFPHVAGIAGQSSNGSQSVVLSGGYEDDADEGEWFLYTGSGGRDLSGNRRTNNVQSFDQKFEKMNQALLVSCQKGLPVRVVRSHKEKRSSYAPTEEQPVRYDGIYRIVRAYRKPGAQGMLVCRYLFVRCDNAAAPWSSEDAGDSAWDGKIPKPAMDEIKLAKGKVYEMGDAPWWNFSTEKQVWGWSRDPPVSQKMGGDGTTEGKTTRRKVSEHEKALKEFQCRLCTKILSQPVSTPCGHHFCKPCIEKLFEGKGVTEKSRHDHGRPLRERKVVKPCPSCKADIAEFLVAPQVNRGMVDAIEKLQAAVAKAKEDATAEPEAVLEADVEAGDDESEQVPPAEPSVVLDGAAEETPTSEIVEPAEEKEDKMGVDTVSQPDKKATVEIKVDARVTDLDALCAEFQQYDRALLEGMLEDQGGDAPEVHACLRRMVRQEVAATKRAAKQIEQQSEEADPEKGSKRSRAATDVMQPAAKRGRKRKENIESENATAVPV